MQRYEKNPRYLSFRGKPILSVGSGEHYGAVLNADFDFQPYLKDMASYGLNQCRVFSGTYRELPGEFGIAENMLAPREEAFLCPWAKRDGRYDLDRWDAAYWKRLKAFVQEAGKKKVLVEYVLFCHWYNDALWQASPMHPANSVQKVGPKEKKQVYSDEPNDLWPYLEKFLRKAAQELEKFDNVYFEIINEPYSDHDHNWFEPFHVRVAGVLTEAAPKKLVALNYANRTGALPALPKNISIVNFHYANPEAIHLNRHLDCVLADDETGFAGQSAEPYRKEAWKFLLSGGAMFSHLDYGYTLSRPDGSNSVVGTKTPGYGGADLRKQLGFLRRFLESIRPWDLALQNDILSGGAGGGSVPILADPERGTYALYLEKAGEYTLRLPKGNYALRWLDTVNCTEKPAERKSHAGGYFRLESPFAEAVLHLKRGR